MVEWLPAKENEHGIETIALEPIDECGELHRTIGFNGILKRNKVLFKDEEYTVVMVSRLGYVGLSKDGQLPYTAVAFPKDLTKLDEVDCLEQETKKEA